MAKHKAKRNCPTTSIRAPPSLFIIASVIVGLLKGEEQNEH